MATKLSTYLSITHRRVHIAVKPSSVHRDVSRTPTDRRPRKRENEAATRVTTVNTLESLDPR